MSYQDSSAFERHLAKTLATTIRARRQELGLTQEQVANIAGIDRNHYQVMESGLSDRKQHSALNPKLFTILKLARALDMTVDEFLGGAANEYALGVKRGFEL